MDNLCHTLVGAALGQAWLPRPALKLDPRAVARNHDHPGAGGTRVHVLDARYTLEPDARIGSATVELASGEGE
jgi:hypothetical protein